MIADALAGKSRGIWLPGSIIVWILIQVFLIDLWRPLGEELKWSSWIEPDVLYFTISAKANILISILLCLMLSGITQIISLKYLFISRKSILPVYISSMIGSVLMLYKPDLISAGTALIILVSFYLLLDLFDNTHNKNRLFTVGFLAGIAVIIDIRALFVILIIWLILILFRNSHWRMWIIALTGFLAPVFICFISIYLWYDIIIIPDLNMFVIADATELLSSQSPLLQGIVLLALPVFLSVLNLIAMMNEKKINLRKYLWSTIFTALFLVLLILITDQGTNSFLIYLLVMISSIILSSSLPSWRKKVLREAGIAYLIASVIVFSLITKGVMVL